MGDWNHSAGIIEVQKINLRVLKIFRGTPVYTPFSEHRGYFSVQGNVG